MGDVFDFASYLRFVAALVFVLGLILVAAHIAKKVMAGRTVTGPRGQGRRLSIVEVLPIDARHRAYLIRRDGKEHLIMTGPSGDLVIENGIEESPRALQQTDAEITPLRADADQPSEPRTPLQKMARLLGDRRA